MTDQEFITKAATLLAQCSDAQRARLVTMVQDFGKSDAPGSAMDSASHRHPPFSEMFGRDTEHGKSIEERFPHLNRLKG